MTELNVRILNEENALYILVNSPTKELKEDLFSLFQKHAVGVERETVQGLVPLPPPPPLEPTEEQLAQMIPVTGKVVTDAPCDNDIPAEEAGNEMSEPLEIISDMEKPFVFSNGPCKGLTADIALKRFGEKALVDLFFVAKSAMGTPLTSKLTQICKEYLKKLPSIVETFTTRERRLEFIENIQPIIDLNLFILGYGSFTNLSYATDDDIYVVMMNIANHLQNRGKK